LRSDRSRFHQQGVLKKEPLMNTNKH
jgi:hypothetical protein